MLDRLTWEQMVALVGTRFHVELDGGGFDLTLTRATKVMENAAARLKRTPFSLLFAGPAGVLLPQRIYSLHHETLGLLEIFLVPVEKTATGYTYEAVFT